MRIFTLAILVFSSIRLFAQYNSGYGYFPIDKVFSIDTEDSIYFEIPSNTAWHKSKHGKPGLEYSDNQISMITDTNTINVRQGVYYFDLRVPNKMITGDSTLFGDYIASAYNVLWNYDIIIQHKHNISANSNGLVLFRESDQNEFDTLGKPDYYSYPNVAVSNSDTDIYLTYNTFDYPEYYKIHGIHNDKWNYTWFWYQFFPVKHATAQQTQTSFFQDTTTIRFVYDSPDNLTGGPGWLIKNIRIRTYICTSDCPSSIKEYATYKNVTTYPNPAQNKLKINFNAIAIPDVFTLKVVSIFGQQFPVNYSKNYDDIELDVSRLNNGLYMILVQDKNTIYKTSFMKTN
jgi:hypothetical protein